MVWEGKRMLCSRDDTNYTDDERVPLKTEKEDSINIEDPYPWLYYKSLNGTIHFLDVYQNLNCSWNPVGSPSPERQIDTFRVGKMKPADWRGNYIEITERETGWVSGYSFINRFYHINDDYHHTDQEEFLFTPGLHKLEAYIEGYRGDSQLSNIWHKYVRDPACYTSAKYRVFAEREPISKLHISPNPFNFICRITGNADLLEPNRKDSYSIGPEALVYDISGRKVSRIEIENEGNSYKIDWNGTDESGQQLPSGAYFIRFVVNDQPQTAKVTLLR